MQNILLTTDFFDQQIEGISKSYSSFLQAIRKTGFEKSPLFDSNFLEEFNLIIKDKKLDTYTPQKYYWMSLIEKIVYINDLVQDYISEKDFQIEIEEEIVDYWKSSEYADHFMSEIGNQNVLEVTKEIFKLQERQLFSYYKLHINDGYITDDTLVYQSIEEFGDDRSQITVGENYNIYETPSNNENYPFLLIKKISKDQIELEDGILFTKLSHASSLTHKNKNIALLKTTNEQEKDILLKIDILEKIYPVFKDLIFSFTNAIIPTTEKNIVSYSLENLPGYSVINMSDRDFIDGLDDILHENGHHFLNSFLIQEELINDSEEEIFFSPWRESTRPIRGLYHAYFTFYWAFKLFSKLSANHNLVNDLYDLNKNDLIKIDTRLAEEYLMLKFCHKQIDFAIKNKFINKRGQKLVLPIYEEINSFNLDQVNNVNSTKIDQLKAELEKWDKEYLSDF